MDGTFLLPVEINIDLNKIIKNKMILLKTGKVNYDKRGARQKKIFFKYPHSTQPRWQKHASHHLETRPRSNINGTYTYGKTHT